MSASTRWQQPEGKPLTFDGVELRVLNSLSRGSPDHPELVPLVPLGTTADGKPEIKWYICGPTVYDHSHLGHARTYVTFDIIRGILEEYYGADVDYCMNITDVDDKIIGRANAKLESEGGLAGVEDSEAEAAKRREATAAIANYWRDCFLEDMRALNVTDARRMPCVSKYIPEIIDFVGRIINNGFGYVSDGSVYFDVHAFRASHYYCKCAPWVHDLLEAADADNAAEELAAAAKENGEDDVIQRAKRNPEDFALWKGSKPGEPYWAATFPGADGEPVSAPGRPGWHIECSAMATKELGETFDIHAGGVDLRFPHHDNELAQSEAALDSHEWCRYFLHAGHLHISGRKMSKSLKNFITISNMLKEYTAAQIRFFFMQSPWAQTISYEHGRSMEATLQIERAYVEAFHAARGMIRAAADAPEGATVVPAAELTEALAKAETELAQAMGDNFSYHRVLRDIMAPLQSAIHQYAVAVANAGAGAVPDGRAVLAAGVFITRFLRACGFDMETGAEGVGFAGPDPAATRAAVVAGSQRFAAAVTKIAADDATLAPAVAAVVAERGTVPAEATLNGAIDALVGLRGAIRALAMANKTVPTAKSLLAACDDLRDSELVDAGVRVEDAGASAGTWKLEDPESLRKARDQERARREAQAKQKAARAAKQRAELEAFAAPPAEHKATAYAGWTWSSEDALLPTHNADGEVVPNKGAKKVKKTLEAYAKKHQRWLALA